MVFFGSSKPEAGRSFHGDTRTEASKKCTEYLERFYSDQKTREKYVNKNDSLYSNHLRCVFRGRVRKGMFRNVKHTYRTEWVRGGYLRERTPKRLR